ncbi:hypothetical protein ACJX0J_030673, partial [Zea mays]
RKQELTLDNGVGPHNREEIKYARNGQNILKKIDLKKESKKLRLSYMYRDQGYGSNFISVISSLCSLFLLTIFIAHRVPSSYFACHMNSHFVGYDMLTAHFGIATKRLIIF